MYDKKTLKLLRKSTIADSKLFKKKKDFFYETSDAILLKGDLLDTTRYLKVFQEYGKRASIDQANANQLNGHLNSKRNKQKTRNISNSSLVFCKNSTINCNQSIRTNSINKVSFNNKNNQGATDNFSVSFKKSLSSTYMGNSMNNHKNFIKCLDDKILKLNEKVASFNKEIIFNIPSSIISSYQQDISNCLNNYLDKTKYELLKTRQAKLYGKENFFKKLKKLKIFAQSPPKKDEMKPKEKPTKHYIKVINDFPFKNNRDIVKNKYDKIGKVKILNIPKEFFDLKEKSNKFNIISNNVKEIYSTTNKEQKKLNNLTNRLYYSRRKKVENGSILLALNDEFNEVEREGNKLKEKIMNVKQFFCEKSPVISNKVFAFIKDPPEKCEQNDEEAI